MFRNKAEREAHGFVVTALGMGFGCLGGGISASGFPPHVPGGGGAPQEESRDRESEGSPASGDSGGERAIRAADPLQRSRINNMKCDVNPARNCDHSSHRKQLECKGSVRKKNH